MQIAMVGLGRMGANMVRRLMRGGHECVVFDRNLENVRALEKEGTKGTASLAELAKHLDQPRAVWVMVPAGDPTGQTVADLARALAGGDTILD